MTFNRTTLFAALLAIGFAGSAVAQSTSQNSTTGARSAATTPAPPASGSTGMDKGAGSATTPATSTARTDKSQSGAATLSGGERRFLETAARHGMAEVELGKLAQDKASHPRVKEFGKRMVDDHSKANEEVKRIAAAKNVQLPTELDRKHRRLADKLAKLSGDEFDREYMEAMEDDHNKDVKEFRSMAKNAKDADVKNFAASTLPTLEQHQQQAKALEDEVKQASRDDRNRNRTAAADRDTRGSTATPGKDTSTTSGTAGPGTGMPSNTARSTGSAPQAPGGPADARSTTSPAK